MHDIDILPLVAGIISMVAYLPLISGIIQNKIEQSFAAFMLWAMIDAIAAVTTVIEEGNFWLPLGNALGSALVAALLMIKGKMAWSRIETMTSTLVIICLVTWYLSGERAGIILSSLAVLTASIPQIIDTFKRPWTTPVVPYIIFLCANIVSFMAGKSWAIEERFYAGCSIMLCVVIILFAVRKVSPKIDD